MPFSKFKIHDMLIKAIHNVGYKIPTPVQNEVMPKIIEGHDLRVSAPTGTGKTAAFLLPALNRLITSFSNKKRGAKILILVPTRELAVQVASQAEKYSKSFKGVKTVCIYGGVSYEKQYKDLRMPHEIIVATPGRLIDHLKRKRVFLNLIEMFVLDEADRMLDMGFSKQVNQIAEALPSVHQTLLFSATLKGNVLDLSKNILNNPLEIIIETEIENIENIDERLHYVDDINHKHKILDHLLSNPEIQQAIIFTSTKHQADELTKCLLKKEFPAARLHGDLNQRQRSKTIMQLREGKIRILVATDIAARGIDIRTISHVINFDLPRNTEDYIHRIGRTARAGARGTAYSFATRSQHSMILSIEKLTGKRINCDVIPGLEPKKTGQSKSFFKKKRSPHKNKSFFHRNRDQKK
jgi:superfamily II DNA/RNA helicase